MLRIEFVRYLPNLATACVLAFASVTGASLRADEALYDRAPPEDAVFIRSFAGDAIGGVFGALPNRTVKSILKGAAVYSSLSSGEFAFGEAGRFYSIVADDTGTLHVLTEPERADRSKVHLILINATSEDVRVTAPEHGLEVFSATAPLRAVGQAVNPIDVLLDVESAPSGTVLETFDLRLRRGQNLTILVHQQGAELIENAFGPVLTRN